MAVALGVVCMQSSALAEWHSSPAGMRYFLPQQWATSALDGGTIARGSAGVSVWLLPLSAANMSAASAPESLFGPSFSRARVISRTASLTPMIASGRWSHGTATFERRAVHWYARVVRLDANRGALAVGITPRATLASPDADQLDSTLNSAYLSDAPNVVRYAGTGTFSMSGRVARTVSTQVIFELRGAGEERVVVMPDLDDMSCTFRGRAQQSGAIRLEPDQACSLARVGITMVLVGGQFEFAGPSTSLTASGRMSFMGSGRRGVMIAGSIAFNWRVQATRPGP